MVQSRYPNRWFGANPQAIANQGRKLSPWSRETPKDWRTALGLDESGTETAAENGQPASEEQES